MEVKPHDIKSKRIVGKLGDSPVVELVTKGGLNMLVMRKNIGMEVLGAGPHAAISKFIAEKKEPDIEWTELSKSSEGYPKLILEAMAQDYIVLTDKLNGK